MCAWENNDFLVGEIRRVTSHVGTGKMRIPSFFGMFPQKTA